MTKNHTVPRETPNYINEHRLLASVLTRAYLDARGVSTYVERQHVRAAQLWFESKSIAPWSFRWLCSHLELSDSVILTIQRRALGYETNITVDLNDYDRFFAF
jgi:hypothetical protein